MKRNTEKKKKDAPVKPKNQPCRNKDTAVRTNNENAGRVLMGAMGLPCRKNERIVLSIEDIGSNGEGIGFYALPGQAGPRSSSQAGPRSSSQAEGPASQAEGSATQAKGSTIQAEESSTQAKGSASQAEESATQGEARDPGLRREGCREGSSGKKGFAIFVKDAVPGDVIEAAVTKVTSRYAYGHLTRILTPSPHRVQPRCPIARTCGGCQLQALSYEQQLAFKQRKVRETLIRIGGFAPEAVDAAMHPIVGMEDPWNYRNKEQVPIQQGKYGPVTGFYAAHSHTVVPMTDCCIGSPANRRILETVLGWMQEHGIPAYDEQTGKGLIRHILIRNGIYSGQVMVCIVANDYRLPFERELVRALRGLQITSIVLNTNTDRTNVITGRTLRTLWGADDIEDTLHICRVRREQDADAAVFTRTGESVTFRISPLSFYQVNPRQTEKLYSLALDCAGLTGTETVWDLYCGVGTISLFMAGHAKKVCGVEVIPEAIENARQNAERNGIENASFYVGKAEEVLPAYVDGLKAQRKDPQIDVICVDPPRKGCDDKCIQTMLEIAPARIVYVSCDPATLARDIKKLAEGGYELTYLQPVDQFAHSVHTEVVTLLVRTRPGLRK